MLPAPPVSGALDTILNFNTSYSCISFASMIASSPDWFMRLPDVNLFQNNQWIKDTIVNSMIYDAGSENGDVFGYDNPATVPQQNIYLLAPVNAIILANGNPEIYQIWTARFIKN